MTMKKTIALHIAILSACAFDNKTGWKVVDGKIEMKDGNPVWLEADGSERTMSADTISNLNREAQGHRETAKTASEKLKAYEVDGKLIDANAAKKALDTVKKIDAKQLIDAGEVDKVRNEIKGEFANQLTEKDKAISGMQSKYDNLLIDNVFAQSAFIRDKVAVPAEMFSATFRGHLSVEDGKIIAKGKDGNRLLSKSRIGEYAEGDEVFELLVDGYAHKDSILKADAGRGSGSNGNGGNPGNPGGKVMKRSEYNNMTGPQMAAAGQQMAKGELTIID